MQTTISIRKAGDNLAPDLNRYAQRLSHLSFHLHTATISSLYAQFRRHDQAVSCLLLPAAALRIPLLKLLSWLPLAALPGAIYPAYIGAKRQSSHANPLLTW